MFKLVIKKKSCLRYIYFLGCLLKRPFVVKLHKYMRHIIRYLNDDVDFFIYASTMIKFTFSVIFKFSTPPHKNLSR